MGHPEVDSFPVVLAHVVNGAVGHLLPRVLIDHWLMNAIAFLSGVVVRLFVRAGGVLLVAVFDCAAVFSGATMVHSYDGMQRVDADADGLTRMRC